MTTPTPAEVAEIANGLGRAQKRVVLSLGEEWGKASCHRTAKRMFYGVGKRPHYLVEHKHRTDNCWCLNELGKAVRDHLRREMEGGK